MQLGLEGKRVLITGAANGIGRATAHAFAREGAALRLLDLDEAGLDSLHSELEGDVLTCAVDLSTEAGVVSGIAEVLGPDGRVDVLVNNVGSGYVRAFDDLDDSDWDATFQLNLFSYIRSIRAVLPTMRAQGWGCIINNASDLGRQPEANPIDYAVSKAAILSLTKALARAEGPSIRINAVAPGPIWTPFWTKPGGFAETMGTIHGMEPQAAVAHEMTLRQLPLGRLGRPEEVADAIVFLASERASFITSTILGVDGGSIRGI